MKKCPFCAEEIQDQAIKCRYCGETLAPIVSVQALVKDTLLSQGKIAAMKRYRECHPAAPLAEASDYVRRLEGAMREASSPAMPEVVEAAQQRELGRPSPAQTAEQQVGFPEAGAPLTKIWTSQLSPLTIVGLLALGLASLAVVVLLQYGRDWFSPSSAPNPLRVISVPPPNPPYVPLSSISWSEIDAVYNLKSRYTDLQKDGRWKNWEGKKALWSGTVVSVSDSFGSLSLQVKMNPDTWTSDLLVTLQDSQRSKALALRKGDRVTFTGVLDHWGSLTPITMKNGEISP